MLYSFFSREAEFFSSTVEVFIYSVGQIMCFCSSYDSLVTKTISFQIVFFFEKPACFSLVLDSFLVMFFSRVFFHVSYNFIPLLFLQIRISFSSFITDSCFSKKPDSFRLF